MPFDALEQLCTGMANSVLVNSLFTQRVVRNTFPLLRFMPLQVLYPAIRLPDLPRCNPGAAAHHARSGANASGCHSDGLVSAQRPGSPRFPTFLSINRFERKKDIGLAIKALGELQHLIPASEFAVRPRCYPPVCARAHVRGLALGGAHVRSGSDL